ncbi:MAG TPA: ABC transporter permease [Vicinamibacterales bacterium]|nr:ABC transporter permease [Vicinamibacterales bacterium]
MDRRLVVSTISVAVVLAAWELAPRLGLVDPFFTSRPSLVLAAAVDVVRSGALLRDAIASLSEFAIGFVLALAVGVPLGLVLGTFETLRFLLDPPIMAVYATPQLALLPIFVLWLGIGMSSKVAVVLLGASIPIIVNSIAGVRQVDRSLVVAARSFGATRLDVFRSVILPASLPAVMIGIRLGLSRAVLGVVVAEMYVSQDGVGNQIMRLGSAFRVDRLLVYVLLVSTFGLAATTAVRRIEERLAR